MNSEQTVQHTHTSHKYYLKTEIDHHIFNHMACWRYLLNYYCTSSWKTSSYLQNKFHVYNTLTIGSNVINTICIYAHCTHTYVHHCMVRVTITTIREIKLNFKSCSWDLKQLILKLGLNRSEIGREKSNSAHVKVVGLNLPNLAVFFWKKKVIN